MGSISHHITPLVINSLGGGDTHTHTQAYQRSRTEAILRNQACAGRRARAWFKNTQLGMYVVYNAVNHRSGHILYCCVYTGSNPLLGDALCMVGALCYAITNVSAEFVAKNFSFTQFLGYLGFASCFISAIQL